MNDLNMCELKHRGPVRTVRIVVSAVWNIAFHQFELILCVYARAKVCTVHQLNGHETQTRRRRLDCLHLCV